MIRRVLVAGLAVFSVCCSRAERQTQQAMVREPERAFVPEWRNWVREGMIEAVTRMEQMLDDDLREQNVRFSELLKQAAGATREKQPETVEELTSLAHRYGIWEWQWQWARRQWKGVGDEPVPRERRQAGGMVQGNGLAERMFPCGLPNWVRAGMAAKAKDAEEPLDQTLQTLNTMFETRLNALAEAQGRPQKWANAIDELQGVANGYENWRTDWQVVRRMWKLIAEAPGFRGEEAMGSEQALP